MEHLIVRSFDLGDPRAILARVVFANRDEADLMAAAPQLAANLIQCLRELKRGAAGGPEAGRAIREAEMVLQQLRVTEDILVANAPSAHEEKR